MVLSISHWIIIFIQAGLSAEQAELMRLRYFEGWTLPELAAKYKISTQAAHHREKICLSQLRRYFNRINVDLTDFCCS